MSVISGQWQGNNEKPGCNETPFAVPADLKPAPLNQQASTLPSELPGSWSRGYKVFFSCSAENKLKL